MGVQFARQSELLGYYRAQGYRVVAGGSFASLCPERYEGLADTVVAGEAEYTWPRFCSDFAAGSAAALYREAGTVALADSPTPRFDLLKLSLYSTATMQFSRGCPYLCEFCDIIVMGSLSVGEEPIIKPGVPPDLLNYTDPMPQALVLTAIVISFATTALFLVVLLASRGLTDSDHVDGREEEP